MKFKNSTVLLHIGFTVAILTLLSIFVYAGVSFNALIESNQRVGNILFVQDRLDETLGLLADAETSQRGYIITGDKAFLKPYTAALDPQTGIRAHLAELRQLTRDNPRQQERLDRLEELIEAKLQFMQENIDLYEVAGFEAARKFVASGRGREGMEAIRALIKEMDTEEDALLQSRSDAASANLRTVQLMFAIGAPLSLAMLMAIFILLAGQIRERRRAEESLRELNAELDQRVTERTAALAESERNYRDLADNALIGIFRSTVQGKVLYVNETLARMGGFESPEAAIQDGAIIRWRDPQKRMAFLQELQRAGRVESYEIEVLKTTGEPMHVVVSAQIRDGQLTGTVLDVTERKQMEDTLRESEEQYRGLFEDLPIAIWVEDFSQVWQRLDGLKKIGIQDIPAYLRAHPDFVVECAQKIMVLDVNTTALKMYHARQKSELIGKLTDALRAFSFEQFEEEMIQIANDRFNFEREEINHTLTGEEIYVNMRWSVAPGYEGSLAKVIVSKQDITERKQQEQIIWSSRERLNNIIESANVGTWEWNVQTGETVFNERWAEIVGYTLDELSPVSIQTWQELAHPDDLKLSGELLEKHFAGELPYYEVEARMKHKEGHWVWVQDRGKVITFTGDGRPEWMYGTHVDITVQKRAEEERLAREIAERANQAKSEFLSRMSHELRTPMNSILGFAQLLKMDELSPDQMGSLEQILKSGRHLLNLINEVLDIARIESGRVHLSPEPVHVAETLEQAVDLIRPLADERGIRIQVRVPSSRDVFVTADRQRLRQVLLNLLSNAVKYNRENGEILITASLLVDGFLHLAVRDTGEGIPPEKMDRLFVAFDRLGLEATGVEGTGLGLALSRGLIEAMGGRMGAQSVVGEGSTFWFDLKLTTQQKEHIVMAEVDDFLKTSPSPNRGLVLYVEDNLSNVQLIEKILARLPGVELISAMQGQLAMDLARQHKPNLILLDMHLPDIHGEKVLEWLKNEPEMRDIPVVVMSADATQHQIERALAAGALAYLTKPIDVKEFLKMISDTLGR